MSKHTPGPWRIRTEKVPNGYRTNIEVDCLLIATCNGSTNAMWDFVPGAREGLANAQLIAAAPDLLDALLEVDATIQTNDVDKYSLEPLRELVKAAIAKATRVEHD